MSRVLATIQALRPKQWSKNGLLLVAMVFAQKYSEVEALIQVGIGIVLFCMLSSAGYLVNDLKDVEADRVHPTKRNRPIASGQVPVPAAAAGVVVLIVLGLGGSWSLLNERFAVTALAYLVCTVSYTLWFKRAPVLDVMLIAAGFILRAVAGAEAIGVVSSPWFLTCILFGALFIGLSKRLTEIRLLSSDAGAHRAVLQQYTPGLLNQLITVTTSCSLISYALYTFEGSHGHTLMLTIPFVIYGVFRYLHLVETTELGGEPSAILLGDRPIQTCMVLFLVTATVALQMSGTV